MSLGFSFCETMSGSYHLDDESPGSRRERAISFTVRASVHDVAKFFRDRTAEIEGEMDIEGFADHAAMRGSLEIDPLIGRKLVYTIGFLGNDGLTYRLRGQKDVDPLRVVETMTTLPIVLLRDDGDRIGEGTLRFDIRGDLWRWLKSFRATV